MATEYRSRSKRHNDPFYKQKQDFSWSRGIPLFLDWLSHERLKVEEWRRFRSKTGHWPVWSILFRYAMLVSLLVGVIIFFFLSHRDDWETSRIVLIGIGASVLYLGVSLGGEEIISRFELHLYRRRRKENDSASTQNPM
jgi:hypothetical protein